MPRTHPEPEVYSISGARSSLDDDMSKRMKRYLISMSIRTVCFLGAVLTAGPLRWVLVGFAVFLPYIAVVAANTGRSPAPPAPEEYHVPLGAIEGDRAQRIAP